MPVRFAVLLPTVRLRVLTGYVLLFYATFTGYLRLDLTPILTSPPPTFPYCTRFTVWTVVAFDHTLRLLVYDSVLQHARWDVAG